jgi:hypothetical protein
MHWHELLGGFKSVWIAGRMIADLRRLILISFQTRFF